MRSTATPRRPTAPWPGRRSSPPAARRLRLRLPRRRGAGPGGVRAQPAVRRVRRRLGGRPRRPEDGHRDQDQAVLRRERGRLQARPARRTAQLRQVLRRPAAGGRARQAQPGRRHVEVPHQRRARAVEAHRGVEGRRALRHDVDALPPGPRRRHRHRSRATRSRCGSRAAARAEAIFTYKAVSETGHRVLVVAAEDYTGASPAQTPGPHYVDYYTDALAANGLDADVYDVDAQGRKAPDALGVLSHYDAVVWYTGDDVVTRTRGPRRRQRRPARARRDPGVPRVHERGRQGPVHRRRGPAAVHRRPVGTQLYDPTGRDRRATRCRPGSTRAGAWRCGARATARTT